MAEPQGASLTKEEVADVLSGVDFGYKVELCTTTIKHEGKIWLNLKIHEDGSAELLSVEPATLSDIFPCLAEAVSKLRFRASGESITVKYPYSLAKPSYPSSTASGAPSGAPDASGPGSWGVGAQSPEGIEKSKHEGSSLPGERRGGFGIYGALIPIDRGVNMQESSSYYYDATDTYWYVQFAGGAGIFGEYVAAPFLAFGLELFAAFPKVNEVQAIGETKLACEDCQQDILLDILFRVKFIIPAAKKISLYPLVLFGYSDYISRAAEREAYHFHGLAFGAGAGIEGYMGVAATPFFELRYMLNAGWHEEEDPDVKMNLLHHQMSLNIGLRFP